MCAETLNERKEKILTWNNVRLFLLALSIVLAIVIVWRNYFPNCKWDNNQILFKIEMNDTTGKEEEVINTIWDNIRGNLLYSALVLIHIVTYLCCTAFDTYCSLTDKDRTITIIRRNELILWIVRWFHFIIALIISYRSVFHRIVFPNLIVIPLTILLFISFFHAFSRTTFRVIPTYMLSFAATLIFLCLSGFGYAYNSDPVFSKNLWGVGIDSIGLATILNDRVPKTFTNSAILVIVAPFFVALSKYLLEKYHTQTTEDSLKTTRRQLLSHWWFNPKAVFIENANLCVAICVAFACVVTIIINFPNKTESDQTAPKCSNIHIEQTEEQKLSFDITIDDSSNEETDQDNALPFLEYLSLFASAAAFVGIVWLFEIKDNDILRNEHYYISYLSLQVSNFSTNEDTILIKRIGKRFCAHLSRGMYGQINKEKTFHRLHDYSQVVAHLFANTSTIRSEDMAMHNVKGILLKMGDCMKSQKTKSLLVSEMTYAFIDTQKRIEKESEDRDAVKKQARTDQPTHYNQQILMKWISESTITTSTPEEKPIEERRISEAELLFSDVVHGFTQQSCSKNNTCDAFTCLNKLTEAIKYAFDQETIAWRISDYELSSDEFVRAIQFDALKWIAQWHVTGKCIFAWLCKNPCVINDTEETIDNSVYIFNRRTLFLLYPIYVCCSMIGHCPKLLQAADRGEPLVASILSRYFNKTIKDSFQETINGGVNNYSYEEELRGLSEIMAGYILGQPEEIKKCIKAGINSVKYPEDNLTGNDKLVEWEGHIQHPESTELEELHKKCLRFATIVCLYEGKVIVRD